MRLGSFGFGGPIALAGYMQRDLVPRGWITSEEYKEGLAFAQMMPGPLAAQLAMWIGFIRHGVVAAVTFFSRTEVALLAVETPARSSAAVLSGSFHKHFYFRFGPPITS